MIKPILFNTEMVQAILDGRKTQTRRVVKGLDDLNVYRAEPCEGACETCGEWDFYHGWCDNGAIVDAVKTAKAPCSIGDTLWVRETWDNIPVSPGGHIRIGGRYYYRADGDIRPRGWQSNWRPSIHMPKEAARIFLKVNDVRAEKLWDMDEEAAIAEGFEDSPAGTDSPLRRFSDLWDKTVKRDDLREFGYYSNPWVWVIKFERCEKPEIWFVNRYRV